MTTTKAGAKVAPKVETAVVNAEATAQKAAEAKVVPIEPQSEKLSELRAKRLEFKKLARTFEPDSAEEEAALLEAYKIDQLIKVEINAINAEAAKQKLEIARNERIALFTNVLVALFAGNSAALEAQIATLSEEDKTAFDTASEVVKNELLTKYATSKPAAAKTAGTDAKPSQGVTKSEIVDLHIANVAAGMTDSESRKALEAAGHKRSTVWFAVDGYNKSK